MRRLALVAVGVLGAVLDGAVGFASPPPAPPPAATRTVARSTATSSGKHPEMLATMERYLTAPLSSDDALEKIRDFVLQSPDVTIAIDELAVPFLNEDLDEGVKNLLMIGFVAGNAASQLRSGVRGDDLIAGVEGELQIYLVLKALSTTQLKDKKVISPRLDALLALQGKGKLRAHLERAMVGRKAPTLADADHDAAASARSAPASRPADAGTKAPAAKAPAAKAPAAKAPAAKDPETDALVKLIDEGVALVKAGRAEEAITGKFDQVIARFEKQYAGEKRHIYCGRDQAEVLLYMTEAAEKGEDAIALPPMWADAWFFKSYALIELHRTAEAVAALDRAIALSPSHAHYLSERGYLYHQAKDWPHSLEKYKAAEEAVKLITDKQGQIDERTRALRGQGYALVELGDLDAGEQKYQQSLAQNPDDKTSRQELDYIKGLRAKRK
jgi:hypothetical protein